MKRILFFTLLLFWSANLNAAPLIKVVAIVNNDAVTSYQLEKNLATAMAADTGKNQLSKEEHQALRQQVLDTMIENLLVDQRIRELGLSVSEQEINAAIEDVQRQNKLNLDQLKNALQAQGMTFDEYQQNLRKEILRYKLIGQEVRSKVEVTNTQVRDYFNAHAEEFRTAPTLRLGRISYPVPEKAEAKTRKTLMQQARITRQHLLDGKPFAEVLTALGGDVEGGDMGAMAEGEINPQIYQVVNGLKVGEVSEPKEALGSIHLFQVLERTAAKSELTDEISATIKKVLAEQNSETRFAEWKKELRKGAIIDIRN